jgi:hypothetical protein
VFLLGVVYGAIANDVENFVGDNETVKDVMAPAGGASLTDSYLSRTLLITALIGAGYAISSALRLRSEETALHAEPVLATPISRPRWVASQLAVTLAGSVVVLTAAGLGTGLAYALAAGDLGQFPAWSESPSPTHPRSGFSSGWPPRCSASPREASSPPGRSSPSASSPGCSTSSSTCPPGSRTSRRSRTPRRCRRPT